MKKMSKIIALLLCVCMLGALLCACGEEVVTNETAVQDDLSNHVNLKWYIRTTAPQGLAEVMEEANKYLAEKLNVTLDLQCIEGGDYEQKMQLAFASGEDFDLVWTSNWNFDYEGNVSKGAFLALDDYLELPELADLKNYYSEGIWGAATVGGKIYGMPMEQALFNQKGVTFEKDILEKYNIEDIYSVDSFEDLEAVYDVVLEGEKDNPNFYITSSLQKDFFIPEVTQITGGYTTGATFIIDGKVTDRAEEYDAYRRRMREWNLKGYFPEGVATADLSTKTAFSSYGRYLPGSEEKSKVMKGKDIAHVPTAEAFLGRNGVQSTLTAVNANSKNPIRALKLLHLMHTDPYMLNLICYGIEGRDWTRDAENPNRMIRNDDGNSYYIAEFMIGSQFLAYLAPSYTDGVWEETKAANESAYVDPNIEFSFDPANVESEIAQVSSVADEYNKIFEYGLLDPETAIPEYHEKLKLAGFGAVMDEIQAQYDEWKATQE